MRRIPNVLIFALTVCLLLGFIVPATAASSQIQTNTSAPQSQMVPRGSTTDDVIAVGQDAYIAGVVTENVLVINGTVHMAPTARVGMVINVGGQVIREPGAQVTEMFNLAWSKPLLNSFAVGAALTLGLEVARLAFSIVMILFPVVFTLLMGDRLKQSMAYLEQSIRRVGVIGLLAFFGCLALALILSVTVIGLPVAVLVVLGYLCIGMIGLSALSVWIGKSVFSTVMAEKAAWVQSLAGASLVTACTNIPAIGPLLFLMIWMVSTGSVVAWLWQNRFRKRGK